MKEISTDLLRLEINRVGSIVVETGLFHPSGVKLHAAGDVLGLDEARALHDANVAKLFLQDFGEDEGSARKSLGIEHVLSSRVVVGDVLADDIRKPDGTLLLGGGTTIDEAGLPVVQAANLLAVPLRHRKLAALVKQAEDYLAKKPAAAPTLKESGTRMRRIGAAAASPVRYLLIPRARVLVGMADDPLRTIIVNGLKSEGHDPVERKSAGAAVEDVLHERPHVLILDLEECAAALARLRATDGVRNIIVLVCSADPKSAKLMDALYVGANDWLPRPPSRDLLNDRIKASQDLLLRRVQVAPALKSERRAGPRPAAKGECELKDPALGKPLPVFTAEIVDLTETGIRLAYNVPRWPCPWAYTPHGVHPRHPYYAYSVSNPMPRELRVTFRNAKGVTVEKTARVVHVSPQPNGIEGMGLTFQTGDAPPPTRQTTIRKF